MNLLPHHIPFRQLADYIEGEIPLDQRVDLEAHLAGCAQCSGELAQLERLIGLMRSDASQNAPSALIDRAIHLFESKKSKFLTSSDLRSRVLAVLHFDSKSLTPASGVRSAKPGARQLLFSTGVNEIDLRIEPSDQAWRISGQILGVETVSGTAILQGVAGNSEAALNELSEFTLPPVQAGIYRLILDLTDVEVEIDEIRVGL
ncbi:MAG TPA: zf-HC2 domain-containing protein [Anaerolineales bacterium]|nr:zf-HC2 domain-containing protein [Anaerolineales bacterium]